MKSLAGQHYDKLFREVTNVQIIDRDRFRAYAKALLPAGACNRLFERCSTPCELKALWKGRPRKSNRQPNIVMSTNSERHQLISVAGLPGRLTAQEAAWVLGFADHNIPVLASNRLLTPLGDPPPNGGRYYALPDLEALRRDTKWLHKASAVLVKIGRSRTPIGAPTHPLVV
jgi:hypothetical protein